MGESDPLGDADGLIVADGLTEAEALGDPKGADGSGETDDVIEGEGSSSTGLESIPDGDGLAGTAGSAVGVVAGSGVTAGAGTRSAAPVDGVT